MPFQTDTCEVDRNYFNDIRDNAGSDEEPTLAHARLKKARKLARRLFDCVLVPNNEVSDDGEIMHLANFIDAEPVDYQTTLKEQAWIDAMMKELTFMEKSKTLE